MKVLVFTSFFWPHKGGVENYVYETCRRLLGEDHKINIVTAQLPGTKQHENYKGFNVYRFPSWVFLNGTYPVPKPGIFKRLEKFKDVDVVISHTRFYPLSAVAARFAKKNKIPHLHIEHGTIHPKTNWLIRPLASLYDHTLGLYVIKSASRVAGVSKAAELFVKHICARETSILYNCVDTNFFRKVPAKKKWKGKIITFVGRLIQAKGVQDLLEATKDIRNITVLVVGSGNFEKQLKHLARNKVKFLGEKNPEEIREVLSATDIFVNPSYAEGLPTSVLEAGSMGLPVIATDVGGTSEIIDENKNGFLVKPNDVYSLKKKIKLILNNPAKSRLMGEALQKKIQTTFDWNVTGEKLKELIKELKK